MAQLAAQMQEQAAAGPGLHVDLAAGLDVRLGRLVSLLEQERQRRAAMSQLLNVVDLPPLDFTVVSGKAQLKTYRAAATDISPQEGLMWFIQRVSLAGLNPGDSVNLYRTVSSSLAANMNAVHTFFCPAPPPSGVASQSAEGSVTNPGAFAAIAFSNSVPAGTYQVTATVYLSGTVTTADANNMQITGTSLTNGTVRIAYPGVANTPVTVTAVVTTGGAGGIGVQTVGAASGVSAVYNASIQVTPLGAVSAGLGIADWEPGSNGLVLRPDDQLWLAAAGALTASELVLTGQAIQVDLRILADFLM